MSSSGGFLLASAPSSREFGRAGARPERVRARPPPSRALAPDRLLQRRVGSVKIVVGELDRLVEHFVRDGAVRVEGRAEIVLSVGTGRSWRRSSLFREGLLLATGDRQRRPIARQGRRRRRGRIVSHRPCPPLPFDRRLTPVRADLAAEHLRGLVDAPRYAKGREMRIIEASAPLRRAPSPTRRSRPRRSLARASTCTTSSEGWAWAQLERDQYVGYLPLAALGAPSEPTHRVTALRTHAYPGPAIKLPRAWRSRSARASRSWTSRAISRRPTDGLYLWSRHLAELCAREPDAVAVAERFLETPYLWGGRTSEGIDCSGLVQTALTAAGVAAPRDSDMQEATLGQPVAIDEPGALFKRGDLVFWKGHVGIMRDPADAASRQRLAHEGGQRAAGPCPRAHRGKWRRPDHQRPQSAGALD